ncbi:hypothetical protein [Salinicoccus roseus]|uniref:hypothetical protein n=1 Tax=Salinicoccus roseus TaxID=45670 RepID=UPI0023009ACE|nr:hypothetical protein [Salinicoccus roseus]
MKNVLDSKEDVYEAYDDIDEAEENLYMEFENIVQHLSEEITEKVMASIVSTPLDEVYNKYETQLLHIKSSTENINKVSIQFEESKKDLFENMSRIISEVSNEVIEDTLLMKLETVKNEYERQLPLLNENSVRLQHLNEKLEVIFEKYNKNVEDLDEKHKNLQEVNLDLNKTKEELFGTAGNDNSELETMKEDIKVLQKNSNSLKSSLKEKLDLQNKIMIGVGVVVTLSLFI